jgi:alpha-L-arabinofuranosidase
MFHHHRVPSRYSVPNYDEKSQTTSVSELAWLSNHTKWDHKETEYKAGHDRRRCVQIHTYVLHTAHYCNAEYECPHFDFEESFPSKKKNKKGKRPPVREVDSEAERKSPIDLRNWKGIGLQNLRSLPTYLMILGSFCG